MYKLTFLNNAIVLAVEPVLEAHRLLPIVTGSLNVTTLQGIIPSVSELLTPIQDWDSKLHVAKMAAVRRSLHTQMLYDPAIVSNTELEKLETEGKAAIQSKNDLNPQAQASALDRAVRLLSPDLSALPALLGTAAETATTASRLIGNNPQLQGGRVKGNKVAYEAQNEIERAEGRFRVASLMLQQTLLNPVKLMLRSNLIQSSDDIFFLEKLTGEVVRVRRDQMDDEIWTFLISDGYLPDTSAASPEVLSSLLQTLAQVPMLQELFDMPTMFITLAKAGGFNEISNVPSPQRAQQDRMAAVQAAQAAQAAQEQGAAAPAQTAQAAQPAQTQPIM